MVAEKQLDEFVSRMQKAAGENLQSVILYGSAAAGDYQPEFSNLNLLCILRETSFAKLVRRRAGRGVVASPETSRAAGDDPGRAEAVPPTSSRSSCWTCSAITACSLATTC